MKKEMILTTALGAITISVLYAAFAFYFLSVNPADWNEDGRSGFAFLAVFIFFVLIVFLVGLYSFSQNKEGQD